VRASSFARASADPGSPAAMASRATSTRSGGGNPHPAMDRASASTDGGRAAAPDAVRPEAVRAVIAADASAEPAGVAGGPRLVGRSGGTLLPVAVLVVLVLAIPIVELYLFVQVSNAIGFWNALGLVILISLLGVWLVKRAGLRVWARFNEELVAHRTPSKQVADGLCLLLAGVLLVVPGFLTDAIGLLLLLPPVRALLSKLVVGRYAGRSDFRVITATYGGPAGGEVIDTEIRGTGVTGTGGGDGQTGPPQAPRGELDHP
jgi:UPF0716 protein FxsA